MKKIIRNLLDKLLYTQQLKEINKTQYEILYALKCNSAFKEISWLCNKSFSPGGWAIGWPGLYILYRTLMALPPNINILEMGLGETSKLINAFAQSRKNINHYIVEHDKEWISFFDGNIRGSQILHCEIENISFRNKSVLRYKNLESKLSSLCDKFNLIVIDGPYGCDYFSRIDILELIPEKLEKEFVIIMDDSNRFGEQQTLKLIKLKLNENHIKYYTDEYEGIKTTTVITSPHFQFLCSLQS